MSRAGAEEKGGGKGSLMGEWAACGVGDGVEFPEIVITFGLQNYTECEILCKDSIYEGVKSRCILT